MVNNNMKIVVALTGYAGSGKDSAADVFRGHYGFRQMSYAAPLYAAMRALFEAAQVPQAYLTSRDLKESLIPVFKQSARFMLQRLGTEWGRHLLHEDVWVDVMHGNIAHHMNNGPGLYKFDGLHGGHGVVISDLRFNNEVKALRTFCDVQGYTLYVVRMQREIERISDSKHQSEQEIDSIVPDITIVNKEGLANLTASVKSVAGHILRIEDEGVSSL
jgi:hypothetical protein